MHACHLTLAITSRSASGVLRVRKVGDTNSPGTILGVCHARAATNSTILPAASHSG
jgi:hypothetical protein